MIKILKIYLFFLCFFCIFSCSQNQENNILYQLTGQKDHISQKSTISKINNEFFITSYHSVSNDDFDYFIDDNWKKKLKIIYKNIENDIAFLDYIEGNGSEADVLKEINFFDANVWDYVYSYVFRDWVQQKITWKILSKNTNVVWLFDNWKKYNFIAKIITDLDIKKGDSWSPIYDKNGNIIDVIHIEQK